MKLHLAATFLLLPPLLLLAFGCDSASRATVEEGDGGPKNPTDALSITPEDAGVDTNVVKPPPTTVEQAPVIFVITNDSSSARYIQWDMPMEASMMLWFEIRTGPGTWGAVPFQVPFCVLGCSDLESYRRPGVDPSFACCIDCGAPEPAMKRLAPGESIQWTWSGKSVVIDNELCECGCWREADPEPGHYKASVNAFAAIECGGSPCSDPDANGVIHMAGPEGDALTSSVEFDVVTTKKRIEIALQ